MRVTGRGQGVPLGFSEDRCRPSEVGTGEKVQDARPPTPAPSQVRAVGSLKKLLEAGQVAPAGAQAAPAARFFADPPAGGVDVGGSRTGAVRPSTVPSGSDGRTRGPVRP